MKSHFDMGECPCERALLFEIAFLDKVKGAAEPTQAPDALKQRIIDRLTDENA